jgi:hypothetical protein
MRGREIRDLLSIRAADAADAERGDELSWGAGTGLPVILPPEQPQHRNSGDFAQFSAGQSNTIRHASRNGGATTPVSASAIGRPEDRRRHLVGDREERILEPVELNRVADHCTEFSITRSRRRSLLSRRRWPAGSAGFAVESQNLQKGVC